MGYDIVLASLKLTMLRIEYKKIFNELVYEIDDPSPSDHGRLTKFKMGWLNAKSSKKTYTNKTLNKRLTWNNLGYRFVKELVDLNDSYIEEIYNFLVNKYIVNHKVSFENITKDTIFFAENEM